MIDKNDCNTKKPFIDGITGVILAGGKSSRFGSNKALAEFRGLPLIERVTTKLSTIFPRLVIISNSPHEYSYLGLPIYQDIIKGLGPIGGIYTGLEVIEDDWGFFTACDMPFVNENLVRYMAENRSTMDAIVPKVDWKMEPLHALYNKKCLPEIKNLISMGINQTIKAFNNIRVRYIEEEIIRSYDPDLKSFLNVNRQTELAEIADMS
jgi:molybdopterin-guanine dinucleotide biosynthesis protein A